MNEERIPEIKDPEFLEALEAMKRDGEKGLGPYIAKRRVAALAAAKSGDTSELARLVREGWALNDDERRFVADMLEGKIRPKRGRKPKTELTRRIGLGFWWLSRDGIPREAAVTELMTIHELSRSAVEGHLKSARSDAIVLDSIVTYETALKFCPPELVNKLRAKDLYSR